MAEAYFNEFNKNPSIEARSAGVILDPVKPFVPEVVISILASERVKVFSEKSQRVNSRLFNWADKIIVVADNVNLEGFPVEKIEIWPIADAHESQILAVRKTMDEIREKVENLVRSENV